MITIQAMPVRWKLRNLLEKHHIKTRDLAYAIQDLGGKTREVTLYRITGRGSQITPNGFNVLEDVIRDIASVQGCEAIYLLTDGAPNPWSKEITSVMQSRYITWYNQAWKVRSHTIGIYTVTDQEKKGIAKNEDIEGMK